MKSYITGFTTTIKGYYVVEAESLEEARRKYDAGELDMEYSDVVTTFEDGEDGSKGLHPDE